MYTYSYRRVLEKIAEAAVVKPTPRSTLDIINAPAYKQWLANLPNASVKPDTAKYDTGLGAYMDSIRPGVTNGDRSYFAPQGQRTPEYNAYEDAKNEGSIATVSPAMRKLNIWKSNN